MTQLDLAVKAGITPGHLSGLEAGKFTPHNSTIRKLAAALGVEPSELVIKDD